MQQPFLLKGIEDKNNNGRIDEGAEAISPDKEKAHSKEVEQEQP